MTDDVLWKPDQRTIDAAQVTCYQQWLTESRGLAFDDYTALWKWSVNDLDEFWRTIWEYYDIQPGQQVGTVLEDASMPGAKWFPGVEVNYVSQVFRHSTTARPAIVFQDEQSAIREIAWAELENDVAAFAAHLRSLGVEQGDRVVAFLPNRPEAVVAFLATASIGAIWSVCAPDLGAQGVLDRFQQIEPKVLVAADGYHYGGKVFDRSGTVAQLIAQLPTLESLVVVDHIGAGAGLLEETSLSASSWSDATSGEHELDPVLVPFDHPLWVLYSSGTTGAPKAIVHGQGGVILEHVKSLNMHVVLGEQDRFFWYSSTAWMMWNFHIAGLLIGTTVCIYDGSPGYPDLNRLWQFIEESGVTFFGAGAAFYDGCRNAGISPGDDFDLGRLRGIGSTGSPLLPESYRWVYEHVGADVYLTPLSGGTDFVSAFIGGVPILPVVINEMNCRYLGAAVDAFDDDGNSIVDEVGELVCTKPLPSMPIFFWNDEDGTRYHDSYFDVWPGIWRHGDWVRITPSGGATIYGRSDATINRHGIRMGTADLYAAVEALPEVMDSLVVDLEFLGRDAYMPLFVVLKDGVALDDDLVERIHDAVKSNLSPRHVPDAVFAIEDVPRTFSGKKLEIPVRKLLLGQSPDKVINRDTMGNPDSIDYFIEFAQRLAERTV